MTQPSASLQSIVDLMEYFVDDDDFEDYLSSRPESELLPLQTSLNELLSNYKKYQEQSKVEEMNNKSPDLTSSDEDSEECSREIEDNIINFSKTLIPETGSCLDKLIEIRDQDPEDPKFKENLLELHNSIPNFFLSLQTYCLQHLGNALVEEKEPEVLPE